ncbi:MAG: CBS domain-containing protein [Dehalococcoidales bacterium]|nr:CBS domain-containing protein [Dehalococcoidales bacterium]
MYVRDIMTREVVTVSSNSSILTARKAMEAHKLRRLPVVDNGKLVGIVTRQRLERVPAADKMQNVWELTYTLGSLYRTPVKQVMLKDVVTVRPDTTLEEAVALAQSKKVGALVVVDTGKVVGIITTNDFFYKIVNQVLGVGEPGTRIEVSQGGEGKAMVEIISMINKLGLKIITLHIISPPDKAVKNIVVQVDGDNVEQLIAALRAKGHEVEVRKR